MKKIQDKKQVTEGLENEKFNKTNFYLCTEKDDSDIYYEIIIQRKIFIFFPWK